MNDTDRNHAVIVKKIDGLTPDMIQEVIDFIDFLKLIFRQLRRMENAI